MIHRKSLNDYLDYLVWSQTELARQAKVSRTTVNRALAGELISRSSALKILTCLSTALNISLTANDVGGLKFEQVKRQ